MNIIVELCTAWALRLDSKHGQQRGVGMNEFYLSALIGVGDSLKQVDDDGKNTNYGNDSRQQQPTTTTTMLEQNGS